MKKIALKTMHRASFFMSIINHKCIFKSLNPWGSSINHADGFLDIFKPPHPPWTLGGPFYKISLMI